MAAQPEPVELSGEAITARIPRLMRWCADVIDASASGDTGYQLEAPTDLPMDEATFVAMGMVLTDLADAAGITGAELREMAAKVEDGL